MAVIAADEKNLKLYLIGILISEILISKEEKSKSGLCPN